VFAVGFIPNWCNLNAAVRCQNTGLQLRFRLMSEPVADAD
jgi:hypothetical protein